MRHSDKVGTWTPTTNLSWIISSFIPWNLQVSARLYIIAVSCSNGVSCSWLYNDWTSSFDYNITMDLKNSSKSTNSIIQTFFLFVCHCSQWINLKHLSKLFVASILLRPFICCHLTPCKIDGINCYIYNMIQQKTNIWNGNSILTHVNHACV